MLYIWFVVVVFPFLDNTDIQFFFLSVLGSEVVSSISGAEIKGIQSKQGMLYNLFIIGVFPLFDNTIIEILFFFYF